MASATDIARTDGAAPATETRRRTRRGPLSSLTRRLLAINLVALLIVGGGIFYLNQYERGLVDERLERLVTQGNIMAAALGELVVPPDPAMPQAMDPVLARLLLQRLVNRMETRARLFDTAGGLVVDSRRLAVGGAEVRLRVLPPPEPQSPIWEPFDRVFDRLDRLLLRRDLPLYIETREQKAQDYVEAVRALQGEADTAVRVTTVGDTILTAAVPVQRFKQVVGALMLDTDTGGIDLRVRSARAAVMAWVACTAVSLSGRIVRTRRGRCSSEPACTVVRPETACMSGSNTGFCA